MDTIRPLFVSLLFSVMLVACGGGGAQAPAPVNVTVSCPNSTFQTAATSAVASAACPAPQWVSVAPADGDATVSPSLLGGVKMVADSDLDIKSLSSSWVTLHVGSLTSVAGVVRATSPGCQIENGVEVVPGCLSNAEKVVGIREFLFVPTSKLQYGVKYDLSVSVKDTLGRTLSWNSTFTTAPMDCSLTEIWNGVACVPRAAGASIDPIDIFLASDGVSFDVRISGTANNTSSLRVSVAGPSGDLVRMSGFLNVLDGKWSVLVSPAFTGGGFYEVAVYDNNIKLATTSFNLGVPLVPTAVVSPPPVPAPSSAPVAPVVVPAVVDPPPPVPAPAVVAPLPISAPVVVVPPVAKLEPVVVPPVPVQQPTIAVVPSLPLSPSPPPVPVPPVPKVP